MPELGDALRAREISVDYSTRTGPVRALDGVSIDVEAGLITAVVGESGSGKSTLARALLRAVDPPGRIVQGSVFLRDTNLMMLTEKEMRAFRGAQIALIPQNPHSSLSPLISAGKHIEDAFLAHNPGASRKEARARAGDVLESVRIPRKRLDALPHELSGGMCQRVLIAAGLVCGAGFIVADEPTTALDVLVEEQFMDLLEELCQEMHTGVLLVSHDIRLVSAYARRVVVMYAGRVVENGSASVVHNGALHPYSAALVGASPDLRRGWEDVQRIQGAPADLRRLPEGCAFHPRCPLAIEGRCDTELPILGRPTLVEGSPPSAGHEVACWLHVDTDRQVSP